MLELTRAWGGMLEFWLEFEENWLKGTTGCDVMFLDLFGVSPPLLSGCFQSRLPCAMLPIMGFFDGYI